MKINKLISKSLSLPLAAISYNVSQGLSALYPDKAIVEGSEWSFNVQGYAAENFCTLEPQSYIHNQISTSWNSWKKSITANAEHAYFHVAWQGNKLDVILMTWPEGCSNTRYYWILADTKEVAESFFAAVCDWYCQIEDDEILVFENGYWQKSEELSKAIKSATFDNLVLRDRLKQDIQDDVANFFASRETYRAYDVPWKRGIMFIGSPGNGKTHAVKALINKMQQNCLYVKSVKSSSAIDNANIREVFDRARQSAPCILVLEDIDSLVTGENRSFFLNELDGFAANEGILTLATTNHPERLDPAILNRPSRFDRKYHFELPALTERLAYITFWNDSLKPAMRLSGEVVTQIAELTDGFSFAYMKELFVSSTIRWMNAMEAGTMEKFMLEQVASLRSQMLSTTTDLLPPNSSESNN